MVKGTVTQDVYNRRRCCHSDNVQCLGCPSLEEHVAVGQKWCHVLCGRLVTKDTHSLRNMESLSPITLSQRRNEGTAQGRSDEWVIIVPEKLCDVLWPRGCSISDPTPSWPLMDTWLVMAHEHVRHAIPYLFATAGSRYI